jgi:Putative transposase
VNVHFHCVFLEGVYLDRTEAGLKPRFVQDEPPSDAAIAEVFCFAEADVVQTISRRVIRKLRHLGYLEAGSDPAVATGYDPLMVDEPALAHTLAASVTQRIACGERAGQKVRRIGAGFGSKGERPTLTGPRCASVHGFSLHANTQVPAHRRDQLERLLRYTARGAVALERLEEAGNGDLVYTFTKPWSDGTTGITLSPVELLEKLAALVPLPRVHLVRYGGCLAPHSRPRGAITPTPRQQGVEGDDATSGSPCWSWARLLKRVFALDLATCPFCRQGALRIIAALTQAEVIRKMLRHLKLAADPPPIAPAHARQAKFDWVA